MIINKFDKLFKLEQQWKGREAELDLARPFLNSDYYWKRKRMIIMVLEKIRFLINMDLILP
jgi:hypothetical protein